ncbi:MAG TPA: 4-alpha-glucanotransferase [Acidimicrobiales bacterium]|nr:4-alpha-glucanotransferase [Acidimicrobiales bacterium]
MTDPAMWGISTRYQDHRRQWREAPRATVDALLAAMGAGAGDGGPPATGAGDRVFVVRAGDAFALEGRWLLRTEDGAELSVERTLPADLPAGYHLLRREEDGHAVRLVVTPGSCFLPEGLHTWGWAVQVPATRSRSSWGIGDLADLRRLGAWSSSLGAGMCLASPLHAPMPTPEQQPSPYFPSSRCFRSPLYLRIEDVPGAAEQVGDLAALADKGRALNADRRIDRDEVWRLKLQALEGLWSSFREKPSTPFEAYCESEGGALAGYATFCALTEKHGKPWSAWPGGLQDPEGDEVLSFVDANRDRIRFHQWLQWLLDDQLAAAGAETALVNDLAIGVDPGGADAWLWQDCFARGVRVGAPADEFNTKGQDWGLPPFDPWRLRAAAYEPFVRTLRAGFRHAGGMRVDHVMGLFRLFWIPAGAGPQDGTYVRYPSEEMLGILALESHRAGAYVVGEDLGNVQDSVREELAARKVLSYRLLWFEDRPPRDFPAQALAAVTTHDLPTIAGLWSGEDLVEQEQLGLEPNVETTLEIHERVTGWTGVTDSSPIAEVVEALHGLVAEAPSAVVVATLEDAMAVQERPNIPGTTDERPNWSLALPRPVEEMQGEPLVLAVAAAMEAGCRRPAGVEGVTAAEPAPVVEASP